jgi:hypothetical protein
LHSVVLLHGISSVRGSDAQRAMLQCGIET